MYLLENACIFLLVPEHDVFRLALAADDFAQMTKTFANHIMLFQVLLVVDLHVHFFGILEDLEGENFIPFRLFAAILMRVRFLFLLSDLHDNKGVHFAEKLGVSGQLCPDNFNFQGSFATHFLF